jgi:hypothetical protein
MHSRRTNTSVTIFRGGVHLGDPQGKLDYQQAQAPNAPAHEIIEAKVNELPSAGAEPAPVQELAPRPSDRELDEGEGR